MNMVRVADLEAGMTVELIDGQRLWDTSRVPWRELGPGARLTVGAVAPMATGRTDRQPYEVTLVTADGTRIPLEVDSGETRVLVVDLPAG